MLQERRAHVTHRYRLVRAGTASTRLAHAQLKSVSNCRRLANSSHSTCKMSSGSAGAILVRLCQKSMLMLMLLLSHS
jgi:hypothetical protein